MSEQWRPIAGYECLYEVSDQGRVRRLDTYRDMPPSRRHPAGWRQLVRGRILKPAPTSFGYPSVVLCKNAEQKTRAVHVLVCATFHGPSAGLEVRHLNGNPSDCRAINLAWGTHAENMADKAIHGTDHQLNKTHCPRGHEYTPQNTRYQGTSRVCRKCHARKSNRRYHATKRLLGPQPKKSHCVNGHALEGNQYPSNGGCITCVKARAKARKEAGYVSPSRRK